MSRKRRIVLTWLGGAGITLALTLACGDEPPAPTRAPSATATQTATATPTIQPQTTIAPSLAPTVTVAPSATAAPSPTPTAAPAVDPDLAALRLAVISPEDNVIVNNPNVAVTGVTLPDAVVSVNGELVTPDASGNFSASVTIAEDQNPMRIEVVASDFTGEEASVIRTVIYIP